MKIPTAVPLLEALLTICLFLGAAGSRAEASDLLPSGGAKELLHRFVEGVDEITLQNGLRVLIFKRGYAPVFAGQIWVKVGGVNELPGATGAAHLLEHMAFKGTDKIGTRDYGKEKELLAKLDVLMQKTGTLDKAGKAETEEIASLYKQLQELWVEDEFARLYQEKGAVGLNAATGKDYTMYQVELPATALELWCWMESERLLNPVFRQFYKEREVVREERRTRSEDSPQGRMYEALLATAYWSHPYRMPVIGWSSDIEALSREDTEHLRETFYRPDNMVIALVGDVDLEEARPLLERYFGRLQGPGTELPLVRSVEGPQTGPRETIVVYDAQPSVVMAYHKPVYPHPDDIYFSVVHSLLSDGRSSLLYRELVLKRQLAQSVYTSEAPGELYPSLFLAGGTPRDGVTNLQLAEAIQKTLDRLMTERIADADLVAAKKRVRVSYLEALDTNDDIASALAHAELLWDDWREMLKAFDIAEATTAEDVRRLVRTYLRPAKRTVIRLEKPAAPEASRTASESRAHAAQ